MSVEGQVDLDALIERDKKDARIKKTKYIEKKNQERREERRRYEEERRNRHHQNYRRERQSNYRDDENTKSNKQQQRSNYAHLYAITISGLLSDVSVDDICKLLGDRKIISIKTLLRNKDLAPINQKIVNLMDVVVVLSEKNQADSFIKYFSEKKLDGKYQLSFSFIDPSSQFK